MRRLERAALFIAGGCLLLLLCAPPSRAELADVYLKTGVTLRGDVTVSSDEVIVRNAAGEVRFARADVERIVPVETPATRPATKPATKPTTGPTTQPTTGATTEPASRPTTQSATTQASRPTSAPAGGEEEGPDGEGLAPAAPLTAADIQRLRLHELRLDGPAEAAHVKFKKKGNQRDLAVEVLEELSKRPDYQAKWGDVLARGKLEEKLQLIVRETGTEHADRIEIMTDPEVFTAFQRRVLPLVNKSCARSGCHGGRAARLFRFPISATAGDAHLYASFVLLDQMQTRHGPLIDRTNPEESVLLSYLLPQENNEHAHPPVKHSAPFKSGLRSKTDPQYEAIVDWINALRYPRPDYGLEYQNPYRQPAPPTSKPAEEAAAEGPGPADKPASRPATRPQSAPSGPARP